MNISVIRFALCLSLLAWVPAPALADVTLRPGVKPSETTKDFVKDIKKNGYPTPEPRNRTFNFTQGLSVDVELEVATSSLTGVKFSIREAPKHGKLSEIRAHPSGESNKAMVTYTHGGQPEEMEDHFTFQARLGEGSNSSAPGTISLVGKRAAPRIEVLEIGKFKRLQPGEMDAARVIVINTGTAAYSSDLKWPEPYVGPNRLDLAINEKQTFMLMIKPGKPGGYKVDLELQPGMATSHVQAYVECLQPFGVSPGAVTLTFDSNAGNRSGMVKVTNGSDAPLTLAIDAPARLKVVRELTLEPRASKELIVSLDPKDVGMFHGELWVIQEPAREKVVIHAEAEPAQISLVSPKDGKIDYGKIEKGKQGEAIITLANSGGEPSLLKVLSLPSPFALLNIDLPEIQPGKTAQIKLICNPTQPGEYRGTFSLGNGGSRIDIALSGSMFDPSRPTIIPSVGNPLAPVRPTQKEGPTKRQAASGPVGKAPPAPAPVVPVTLATVPTPKEEPKESENSKSTELPADPKQNSLYGMMGRMSDQALTLHTGLMTWGLSPDMVPELRSKLLDAVPAIGVSEVGKDYMVIGWQKPKIEPKEYLLQTSKFVANKATGLPFKIWSLVTDWKKVPSPSGTVSAQITGLKPGVEYEWRVVGVDEQGKYSPGSDLLRVMTQPQTKLPVWAWLGGLGVLLALVGLIVKRVNEQRMLAV